ncbi:hypothetical protein BDY19DRAFT_997778 [Irpex rosettiformis]|uniref:Uncharacterized protein n=1 Tax=Irpex rosettiformis TaxID=378272 RepID=A0ACB8TRH4_9APHY|nr:hypothetical protein BDY19DRAFT_997778 [Irpex rosettiformis]
MPSNEDTDYMPSQDHVNSSHVHSQKQRALRIPELTETSSKLKRLYYSGGALDSQTTDSQYIDGLIHENTRTAKAFDLAIQPAAAVKKMRDKRRRLALIGKSGLVGTHVCKQYGTKLLKLERKVKQLEAALDEMRGGAREPCSSCPVVLPGSHSDGQSTRTLTDITVSAPRDMSKSDAESDYDSDYENHKALMSTQYGTMWMDIREESQIEVSPPRHRGKHLRNPDTSHVPISRLREVHNGDYVEYYASQTQL